MVDEPKGVTGQGASDQRSPVDQELDGSSLVLHPWAVKPYSNNPRHKVNPRYEEIKDSIRSKGLLSTLTVTRRPDEADFTIYGGGNTRISVLQELAEEAPADPCFTKVTFIYRAWRGEADVLDAHLVENDVRSDLSFWEKAQGLMTLKRMLEVEGGIRMSSSEFRRWAEKNKRKISRELIQLAEFATETLFPVGDHLSHSLTKTIRERFISLSQLVTRVDPTQVGLQAAVIQKLAAVSQQLAQSPEFPLGVVAIQLPDVDTCLGEVAADLLQIPLAELKKLEALTSANPSMMGHQLRGEAARAVLAQEPQRTGRAQADLPIQAVLPTPMLAAVQAPVPGRTVRKAQAAPAGEPATRSIDRLRDAVVAFAHATDTQSFVQNANIGLGFFVEIPPVALTEIQQAGWVTLATLSTQLDRRTATAIAVDSSALPVGSELARLLAVRHQGDCGPLRSALSTCGFVQTDPKLGMSAEALFTLIATQRVLGSFARLMQAIGEYQVEKPTCLPEALQCLQ